MVGHMNRRTYLECPREEPDHRYGLEARLSVRRILKRSTWRHSLVGKTVKERVRHLCHACLHYLDRVCILCMRAILKRHQVISLESGNELELEEAS